MATFTVTTLNDELDDGATVEELSNGDGLSLREAVELANASAGADRIEFAGDLSGLMRMAQSQINIRNDALEIDGGGRITITGDRNDNDKTVAGDISTLAGNGAAQLSDNVRAFFVREGADTTLIGLTLTGGRTRNEGGHGGVVYSQADLTLIDSLVSGNSTSKDNAKGGGLFSRTSITLVNSTVTNNSTVGDNSDGGALAVERQDGFEGTGAITLTNSTVSGSLTTGEYASGGGIYTQGALTITGSVVEGNRTTGYNSQGGGTYSQGAQTITDSRIIENSTTNYRNYGGGAFSEDALTVIGSTIDGNFTTGRAAAGGGLYAGRKLVVTGSSITNNHTEDRNAEGGGAYAKFSGVEITDSVISGNSTNGDFSGGGGIAASSDIYLTNTTVSGNSTNGLRSDGGGVSGSDIYLINSTITGNRTLGADSDGGGVATQSIRLSSENSIILGNDVLTGAGDELAQGNSSFTIGSLTLTGRNIIGSDDGALSASIRISESSTGSREYAEPVQVFAETATVDGAVGGVLADKSGPVQTIALNADAANPALNVADEGATAADARGVEATGGRDLGAYELIADASLVVTTGVDVLDANDGVISLREAVYRANTADGPNSITFAANVEDAIRLTEGEILIFDNLTIDGAGRITITGDANGDDRKNADGNTDVGASSDAGVLGDNSGIFYSVGQNYTLTVDGLTLTGGYSDTEDFGGGAIRANGDVSILNSTVSGNSTAASNASGGAVFARGDVNVVNSTVADNSTGGDYSRGGGIFASGAVRVTESSISGNSTTGTGARGGGVYSTSDVVVTSSTISGNSTTGDRADGGGVLAFRDATVTGSTITGNSTAASDAEGGGIFAGVDTVGGGTLTVANSIVLGNVASSAEGDELFKDTPSSSNDGLIGLIGANIIGADSAAFNVATQTTGSGGAQNAAAAEVFAVSTNNNGVRAGVLADNGGPVQTVALRADKNNPALDASANTEPDGRGLPRVDLEFLDNGGIGDLGAFELQDQILFAPSFTIGSAFLVAENQTNVGTISASDDGGGVLFAITGGADAAFFAINAVSGALTFSAPPDFEAPGDANRNNIYLVTVRATDNDGISEDQTFSVTVTDVADTPNPPTTPTPSPGPTGPTSGDDTLVGTAQNDRIDALGGNDDVSGLAGDDLLFGRGGDDILRGAAGDDSLRGNGGDDTLRGNGGEDNIKGNGGEDFIRGNGGADVIRSGGGIDNVRGGGGADLIFGGGGADDLRGGGGADTIRGNGGDDTLTGNGGADVFQFRASDRNDTISDFRQGQDKIQIQSGANSFEALSIEQDGRDVLIGFGVGQVRVVTDSAGSFDESDFIF